MRRSLISVAGLTPQVVTETVQAHAEATPRFVADDLHILTTTAGRERAIATLPGDSGWLAALRRDYPDYQLPEYALDRSLHIHLVAGPNGPLDDIRTNDDNIYLANAVAQLVRDLTEADDRQVNVSIAGGRKTMSFWLGYALSIFGRRQDRASHVLVTPAFESCPNFFFKPKQPRTIEDRHGNQLNTADATIELGEIPFVRLRPRLNNSDKRLMTNTPLDFFRFLKEMNIPLEESVLFLDDRTRSLRFGPVDHSDATGSIEIRFDDPFWYAVYRLYAEAAKEQWPGAGPDGIGTLHAGWLRHEDFTEPTCKATERLRQIYLSLSDQKHHFSSLIKDQDRRTITAGDWVPFHNYLGKTITDINNHLTEHVMDTDLLNSLKIQSPGKRGPNLRRGLGLMPLTPDRINLCGRCDHIPVKRGGHAS